MKSVIGGSLPAEAWRRFMLAATRGMPVRALPGSPPLAAAAQPERPGLGAFLGRLFGFLSSGQPPSRPQ
jgi:penicillin-binding protein 1A